MTLAHPRFMTRSLISVLVASAVAGCTMIPKQPAADAGLAQAFPQAVSGPADSKPAQEIAWSEYFADAQLREVISLALANNRDLRVAALTIEKTRAQYQIDGAALFPSITADVGQTGQRTPGEFTSSGNSEVSRKYSGTVGFASYELDVFGRIRSLKESALETFLATQEARLSVQISLIAEVASAWLRVAADRERLTLAEKTYEARQKTYALTQRSFEMAIVSELELRQAESLMESARAEASRLTSSVAQSENALAALVGAPLAPDLLPKTLSDRVSAIAELPVGLPSELLTLRPDIRQAERNLRAANANIGAARAAFFPTISLTASAGSASSSLDNLFESGTRTWSFIPKVSLPIFTGGRLRASLNVAEIQRDINVSLYEKAIQQAFREVSDALSVRANVMQELSARRQLVTANSRTAELTRARYAAGIDSSFQVLDAERTLFASELELINTRLTDATNRVTLYKALGGGVQ